MGQSPENFKFRGSGSGTSVLNPTSKASIDPYEKAPGERAAGQASPRVVDDLVSNFMQEKQPMKGGEDFRMAADILDSETLKSLAHESTRTKYGPGQLSKSPGSDSYLGQASYPAG